MTDATYRNPHVGKELIRSFDLSGNRLVVKSSNPNEHRRVTGASAPVLHQDVAC